MATIEQNTNEWNGNYDWQQRGDEWSEAWAGPEPQWFGAIFPRIHAFLPTDTILEIAPGFGRWTEYLYDHCRHLIVVDLSERCIEACKKRFSRCSNIEYYVNDGKSLDFLLEESIDFAFSFDSLVHAEADVIEAYLRQLATKLKSNGIGFIHHSNLASYIDPATKKLPSGFDNNHWRAESMSATLFEKYCEAVKLQCIGQEKVNWGEQYLNDVFSVFTRTQSYWSRPNRLVENSEFMREADYIHRLAHLYSLRTSLGSKSESR